jgi:hypothetical protein
VDFDFKSISDSVIAILGPDEVHSIAKAGVFEGLGAVDLVFFIGVDCEEMTIWGVLEFLRVDIRRSKIFRNHINILSISDFTRLQRFQVDNLYLHVFRPDYFSIPLLKRLIYSLKNKNLMLARGSSPPSFNARVPSS